MLVKKLTTIKLSNEGRLLGDYILTKDEIKSESCVKIYKGVSQNTYSLVTIKQIHCKKHEINDIEFIITPIFIPSPFLVNFYDAFFDEEEEFLYLVFDYYNGSFELYCKENFEILQSPASILKMPEKEVLKIFFQIFEGASWLWSNNIIHENIRPNNIFYRTDNNISSDVFLLSCFRLSSVKLSLLNSFTNTPNYTAPEIIRKEEYSYLVDIWALGLTLHEMLFGVKYYDGENETEIFNKILSTKYELTNEQKNSISIETQNLLQGMIQHDQSNRMTNNMLENAIKKFKEYKYVRKPLEKFKHVRKPARVSGELSPKLKEVKIKYAQNLHENAWNLCLQGYDKRAKDIQQEAMEIFIKILGEDAKETRFAMVRYAQALTFNEKLIEAEKFACRALQLYEKDQIKCDPDIARAYAVVGHIKYRLEDYKSAREYQEKDAKIMLEISGEFNRDTAMSFNNLGVTLLQINDVSSAKNLHAWGLKINSKLYGSNHFETSLSYYNLALDYFYLRDYKNALKVCSNAIAVRKKYYGKKHGLTRSAEQLKADILKAISLKKITEKPSFTDLYQISNYFAHFESILFKNDGQTV